MSKAADFSSKEAEDDWHLVRAFLREHPELIRRDSALLAELNLRANASNVVEFIPPTIARLEADRDKAVAARRELEEVAEANFAIQSQAQAAVLQLLASRNHSDLARRVDEMARNCFDLVGGVVALEGLQRVPVGWLELTPGGAEDLLDGRSEFRLGHIPEANRLFGERAEEVRSTALIRLEIWGPARHGVLAFGSDDPDGFFRGMATELIDFLGRVVERTAERWPVL